jgi:hypothetical protein
MNPGSSQKKCQSAKAACNAADGRIVRIDLKNIKFKFEIDILNLLNYKVT